MDTITVPLDPGAIVFRLAAATILGGLVGLNREMSLKPAGLRTHALVSMGAALVTMTGLFLSLMSGDAVGGVSRVVQGVVAGIGFIGGGVILHHKDQGVRGLTTAASIWIVSATGIATGAGLWISATTAVLLALAVLTIGGYIDRVVHRHSEPSDLD